jgi:DNA invertase Pin-like site-specific DNA recombinase
MTERTEAQREASRLNGKKGGRPRIAKKLKEAKTIAVVPEINREAYAELARLASNFNQVAKHMNQNGLDVEEVDKLYVMLAELRKAILGMRDDH